MVISGVAWVQRLPNPKSMSGFVRTNIEHALREQNAPPPRPEPFRVSLSRLDKQEVRDLGFDAELYIPSTAKDVLSFEIYASLEDRFASAQGVIEAIGEDRELFLLRLEPKVRPPTLRKHLQAVLDAAVAEAQEGESNR